MRACDPGVARVRSRSNPTSCQRYDTNILMSEHSILVPKSKPATNVMTMYVNVEFQHCENVLISMSCYVLSVKFIDCIFKNVMIFSLEYFYKLKKKCFIFNMMSKLWYQYLLGYINLWKRERITPNLLGMLKSQHYFVSWSCLIGWMSIL